MVAAKLALCLSHLACKSAMSTLPASSQATTTTCMPTICALAGLVPWALAGIKQMLRWLSPLEAW